MKYYYQTTDEETIRHLGKSKKVPNRPGYYEITHAQYTAYMLILESIEDREGFIKIVTLYIDGSYTVNYTPIEE